MFTVYFYIGLLSIPVYGRSATSTNNDLYKQINKENIRNSLNKNGANYTSDASETSQGNAVQTDELNTVLKNISERFLPDFLRLDIVDDNVKLYFDISKEDEKSVARKMSSNTSNMMQYALVPSFLMAGILPWVMPKLQMAVMMISMLNNMIFSSALFSLVRSYVFEHEPDEHIVYINHGYRNKPHHEQSYHGH